jgi:signal transduction histidine kinase/ActR/RegA family two-component response regulator
MSSFALFAERSGAGLGGRLRALPSADPSTPREPSRDWLAARMLMLVSSAALVLGVVYAAYFIQAGRASLALLLPGCAALAAATGWLGRALGRDRRALEIVCMLLFAAFAGATLLQDGVRSPALWWMAVPPLVLLLAGSMRVGVFLCLLFVAQVVLLVRHGGASGARSMLVGDGSAHLAMSMALSTAFVGVFAALSAHWSRRLQRNLEAARVSAQAATDAKARFVAQVSHEIRTPLQTLIGAVELLRDPVVAGERRAGLVSVQQRSAEMLLALVNDVLDFSKLDAGRMTLEHRPVDLFALLDEVGVLFAPQAAEKRLSLGFSRSPDVPRVLLGDALRLRQVVANLVANAVRFTSQGGVHVRLALDRALTGEGDGDVDGDARDRDAPHGRCRIRIEVADSGVGIAPERLSTLFRPFEQADDSISRRFGGTGLGLSIADELARLMQGRLEVVSTPGQGSTFTLVVPLAWPADADASRSAGPAAHIVAHLVADEARLSGLAAPQAVRCPSTGTSSDASRRLDGLRVLVVEDDAANRLVVEAMLERLGARPLLAADADAAVRVMLGASVDAVLLDLHLDGVHGLSALHRLQSDTVPDAGRQRPAVVAMTGSAEPGDAAACRAAGVGSVLVKPFTLAQLERALLTIAPVTVPDAMEPDRV